MDSLKIYKVLPLLEDYDNHVVDWIEDLGNLMRVCNIKDPERIFTWACEAVDANTKAALRRLVDKRNNVYPSLKDIQKAIEKHKGVTEGDKLTYLQGLIIQGEETIKSFNDRYRRLYHDLPRDYQKILSVKNYRNSIKSRNFAYSQVFISKCESLNEAYEIAETAEEAEKEWERATASNQENYQQTYGSRRKISNNISMLTQNIGNVRRNRTDAFNYFNNNLESSMPTNNGNFRNRLQNYFQYNNPSSRDYTNNYNNFRRNNYYGNIPNNNNNINRIYNNSNSYNNKEYGNFSMRPTHYYNNNNYSTSSNFNAYNEPLRRNYQQNNNDEVMNGNPNNNQSQINKENTEGASRNKVNIYCHRCYQTGHKSNNCPYTFKQLADMEEKGLLPKRNLNL